MNGNASPSEPLVELSHVAMSFGNTMVHRDISFTVDKGEVLTMLGPSGTGKTVILKLIIGLLSPSQGHVRIGRQNLQELDQKQLRLVRKNIGMLFQGAALFDSLTVFENVAFALREFQESSEEEIRRLVEEKLSLVGLPEVIKKYPPELSGGQKKRVGLARALATNPQVMLFDEPTTGLDPTSKSMIDSLIMRLRDDYAITSIVVTHDMESARKISDRLLLLSQGRVVVYGAAADLWDGNPLVHDFANGAWKD